MPYHELDPEIARKAIEGYENELEPALKKLDAFYRHFDCIQCGGPVDREVSAGEHGGHAFSDPDTLVARSLLRCRTCSCLFDPHTSMVLERGNSAKVVPAALIRSK